jgi:hypothetical protein
MSRGTEMEEIRKIAAEVFAKFPPAEIFDKVVEIFQGKLGEVALKISGNVSDDLLVESFKTVRIFLFVLCNFFLFHRGAVKNFPGNAMITAICKFFEGSFFVFFFCQ